MNMSLSIRTGILFCSAVALLSADILTLRTGETVKGTFSEVRRARFAWT